jgi:hypothetical protein
MLVDMNDRLEFYFDAAGHPADRNSVVVAALVSTKDRWVEFQNRWQAVLMTNQLGMTFHMTDFEREYKNHPAKNQILAQLISVISAHTWGAFSSIVPMDDYLNVNSHYFLEEYAGKPYAIASLGTYTLFQEWKKQKRLSNPHLVFYEKGDMHVGDMLDCFHREGEAKPIPTNKESSPTQAADLVAWEVAHNFNTGLTRPSFVFLREALRHNTLLIGTYSKRQMRDSMELTENPRRKDAPRGFEVRFATSPKRRRLRQLIDRQ